MNSSADLKAFVGQHGGAVCTSSNARAVLEWALTTPTDPGAPRFSFLPDQHLGRNTAMAMGYTESEMAVWIPRDELGGLDEVAGETRPRFLLVEGPLLGAPAFPTRAHRRRSAPRIPTGSWHPPRVQLRGVLDRRSGWIHRVHHQAIERRAPADR